jgi:hypothetical protein
LVRGSTSLPTTCSSQVTGTPAALKMLFTALAISGPTPVSSGGISDVCVQMGYKLRVPLPSKLKRTHHLRETGWP